VKSSADGVVTEEEQLKLKSLQLRYGITDEQVESIAAQVQTEKRQPEAALFTRYTPQLLPRLRGGYCVRRPIKLLNSCSPSARIWAA
jgi:uncharacterized tellurite resistance protein B-like protein